MNTLYFVEHRFARLGGSAFLELDRDSNSRHAIIDLIRSGEVDPVTILEVDESEGRARNVTAELIEEAGSAGAEPYGIMALADETIERFRPDAADRQAFAFDRARDARKHSEAV